MLYILLVIVVIDMEKPNKDEFSECRAIIANVKRQAANLYRSLSLSDEDVKRISSLWRSLSPTEKYEIVEKVHKSLMEDPLVSRALRQASIDEEFMRRHIYYIAEKVCAGQFGGKLGVLTFIGAANAIMLGLNIRAITLVISAFGSMLAEKAPDKDTALSVVKVCLWCLVMLVENYVFINETVMLRASGIKKAALDNLIRIYSKDIGARLKKFMEEHPEELA